jgi:hypothetical protein
LVDAVKDWPLAICDGTTVSPDDLVETDHVRRQYTGSTMYLKHNDSQRFYYMNEQGKNDVLIFKNFDSKKRVKGKCDSSYTSIRIVRAMLIMNRCSTCLLPISKSTEGKRSEGKHRS